MIVLSAKELKKEYGTDVILEDVSFHVEKGDRVGIVGPNGAGKTTLLSLLTGELVKDGGEIYQSADLTIGYLHQRSTFATDNTVMQEVELTFGAFREMEERLQTLSEEIPRAEGERQTKLIAEQARLQEQYQDRGGFTYESEAKGILASLAFPESKWQQPIAQLSGGEKTRLALALLLMKRPKLLILDEPTNHLDIGTLRWLEQYLASYGETLLVVSHDRYFLDRTCNRIFEVQNHTLRAFDGNYTTYARRKKEIREEELRRYRTFQEEKKKQEDIVRRFKERGTEKLAKRAHSREMKLEKMGDVKAPTMATGKMKIRFEEKYKSGNDVLLMEEVSKSVGFGSRKKQLFDHVAMDLKRGERVCMVGANGIGKTTLLKLIMEETTPDGGRIKKGHNVRIAYYDQEQHLLDDRNTVLDEIWEGHETRSATEMRSILGRFLFRGDDVFLPVGALSGGEKARLALLKLIMSGGNLLLLDEPTNHLDIESREVFEDALLEFPGAAIIVSHDRYFLNKVPTRIVELESEGLVNYLGKYDYYYEKKKEIQSGRKYLQKLSAQGTGHDGCKGATGHGGRGVGAAGQSDSGAVAMGHGGSGAGASGQDGRAGSTGYSGSGAGASVQGGRAGSTGYSGSGAGASGQDGRAGSIDHGGSSAVATGRPDAIQKAAGGAGQIVASTNTTDLPPLTAAQQRLAQKQKEAIKRRMAREKAALEQEIATLEAAIAEREQLMCRPEVLEDHEKLRTLDEALKEEKAQLEMAYEKWIEYE